MTQVLGGSAQPVWILNGELPTTIESEWLGNAVSEVPDATDLETQDGAQTRATAALTAALAADGVDFSTLSNMLVVDDSFTEEETPGWGVTAFADMETAAQAASSGSVVMVSGTVTLTNDVDISGLYLLGIGDSVVDCGTNNMFVTAGEAATVERIANTCPISGYETAGDLVLIDCTVAAGEYGVRVSATGTLELDGTTIISTSGLNPCILVYAGGVVNHIYKSILMGTTAAMIFVGGSTVVDIQHSTITGAITNATISPLNHSNLVDGATYREIVLLASLPAASSANQGATAMTSDGGTAGIPAFMANVNGTAWIVVAE